MSDVLDTIGDGLSFAFQMAWEVWWALILGFLLSGIVQAWFTRSQMERVLGGRGFGATMKATGLGAASSSCSYAAIAIAKSVFQKGAGLPAAVAFMFASTNLVFELGIVLWIFLGPEFTAAEFAGGFLLILLMWAAVHLFVSGGEEEAAREHARAADTGHQHTIAAGERPLREQLTSVQAWSDVAHNFRADWQMLWKEMTAGFLIAGFVGLLPLRARAGARDVPVDRVDHRARDRAQLHRGAQPGLHPGRRRLIWLTVRRGFTDPVCGMRVDRYQTPHRSQWHDRPVFFCSQGCKERFDADPDAYADRLHGTLGWHLRRPLKERA